MHPFVAFAFEADATSQLSAFLYDNAVEQQVHATPFPAQAATHQMTNGFTNREFLSMSATRADFAGLQQLPGAAAPTSTFAMAPQYVSMAQTSTTEAYTAAVRNPLKRSPTFTGPRPV